MNIVSLEKTSNVPDGEEAPPQKLRLGVVPLGLRQSLLSLALGLIMSLVVIVAIADNPYAAARSFILGSFENKYSFGTMIAIATVLGITGIGSAVGFKAGAFNIGTEGQLLVGGLASALVALYLPGQGGFVVILALLAASVMGALWILVPALLRIIFETSELLTTLMMNYVASTLTSFLVVRYFRSPESGSVETSAIAPERWLPRWFPPSNANLGVVLMVAIAGGIWFWLTRTKSGMRLQVTGLQPAFTQYLGLPYRRILLSAMLINGALCGLAGGVAILGISHAYLEGFSPQYGFLGITVALIGRLNPMGVVAAAFLYAALMTGATAMQVTSNVPFALVYIVQGAVILMITSRRFGRISR